jgi:hypothetical protein
MVRLTFSTATMSLNFSVTHAHTPSPSPCSHTTLPPLHVRMSEVPSHVKWLSAGSLMSVVSRRCVWRNKLLDRLVAISSTVGQPHLHHIAMRVSLKHVGDDSMTREDNRGGVARTQ